MDIIILNWRDIKHPEAGGAEVHLHEIFSRLAARSHRVTLLTTRFNDASPEEVIDGIRVLRKGHTYTFNLEAPFILRRLIRSERPDCVVDDVNKIPFFTPRWLHSVPSCAFFHHIFGRTVFGLAPFPFAAYVFILERLSGWGYRDVPVCTVSQSTAGELSEYGFNPETISIIENSVDTTLYTPDSSHKESDMLLYFGRLKRYKNVKILLDVLKRLSSQGRYFRLVIGGSGNYEQELRRYARELGIEKQVTFTGFVSEDVKIDLYRKAALFINPSLKEGWGITNIEANACGTAVIANNAPGLRDSVKHGKTGLLYKENDLEDLYSCIVSLADDFVRRESMEREGRKWAQAFSWGSSAERVEEWLEKVCRKAQV